MEGEVPATLVHQLCDIAWAEGHRLTGLGIGAPLTDNSQSTGTIARGHGRFTSFLAPR